LSCFSGEQADRLLNLLSHPLAASERSRAREFATPLSNYVVTVDPDPLTVAPCPMSRAPDVIGTAHVIARAASIVWPISNCDRNGAWIGAITGAVRTITGITRPVRTITRITGAVRRMTVIISTSACAKGDRKQKKQVSRPFLFRSSRGRDGLYLRVFNNLCSHIRNSKSKAARCEEN